MSLRTPPVSHDTKTTDFGGWEMPVEFDSIRTEHEAVRERVELDWHLPAAEIRRLRVVGYRWRPE